jgi:hypothetical protein
VAPIQDEEGCKEDDRYQKAFAFKGKDFGVLNAQAFLFEGSGGLAIRPTILLLSPSDGGSLAISVWRYADWEQVWNRAWT